MENRKFPAGCYLLLLTVVGVASQAQDRPTCSTDADRRQDCGFGPTAESTCKQRGCCWKPCESCERSTPWCYLTKEMDQAKCVVPFEDKMDCGYYGIDQSECVLYGCCWRPSGLDNDPWCYKPIDSSAGSGSGYPARSSDDED